MSEGSSERGPAHPGTPPLCALLGLAPRPSHAQPPEPAPVPEAALVAARAEGAHAADLRWQAVLAEREQAHAIELAAARAGAEAIVDAAADCLADLLLAALRAVVGQLPPVDAALLRALAEEAIRALPEQAGGMLRLAPQDLAACGLEPPEGWGVRADPSVPPGTVRAELGPRLAMAGLEQRLAQLAAALLAEPRS